MNKLLMFLGFGLFVGCSFAPDKTDITCQSGHGTCYVVHCQARSREECVSYFKGFCPKGFDETTYGLTTPTNVDRLVECK